MRRLTDDGGNVVIITALIMTTLFGFLALVIDVGSALVRRGSLQTGADAAALAIAKRCADAVVTGSTTCTTSIAQGYFNANLLGGATATLDAPILQTSYAGKVGRITVSGSTNQPAYFAPLLGFSSTQTVRASATARWGPLTAEDAVFPLAVCKGALPPVNTPVDLVVSPALTGPPNTCDGAAGEQPFGWVVPDDPTLCQTKITLLPSRYLNVLPASQYPTNGGCQTEIQEIFNDVTQTAVCHTTPKEAYHCHGSATAADRQRTVVVYDAAAGGPGGRPSYSLVSLEFTAVRLGTTAALSSAASWPAGCTTAEAAAFPVGQVQCFRAIVRNAIPPSDGPIFDPALAAALPNIDDTTVLDVRLVD